MRPPILTTKRPRKALREPRREVEGRGFQSAIREWSRTGGQEGKGQLKADLINPPRLGLRKTTKLDEGKVNSVQGRQFQKNHNNGRKEQKGPKGQNEITGGLST